MGGRGNPSADFHTFHTLRRARAAHSNLIPRSIGCGRRRERRRPGPLLPQTPRAFFWAGNTLAPGPRLPVDVAMLPSGLCVAADPLAGALFAMQLVTADVRVAFGAPGDTAIPEQPLVHATKRFGFRSRLRITAMRRASSFEMRSRYRCR